MTILGLICTQSQGQGLQNSPSTQSVVLIIRVETVHQSVPQLVAFVGVVLRQVAPPPCWHAGPGTGQTLHTYTKRVIMRG